MIGEEELAKELDDLEVDLVQNDLGPNALADPLELEGEEYKAKEEGQVAQKRQEPAMVPA